MAERLLRRGGSPRIGRWTPRREGREGLLYYPRLSVLGHLRGTTAVTLLSGLIYVRRHRPAEVLCENTLNVRVLFDLLMEFFTNIGYVFWHVGEPVCPSELLVPMTRPRLFFGARRRNSFVSSAGAQGFGGRVNNMMQSIRQKAGSMSKMPLSTFVLRDKARYLDTLLLTASEEGAASNEEWGVAQLAQAVLPLLQPGAPHSRRAERVHPGHPGAGHQEVVHHAAVARTGACLLGEPSRFRLAAASSRWTCRRESTARATRAAGLTTRRTWP